MGEWFNWQIIQSVIRNIAQAGAGILVGQGLITGEQEQLFIGAVVAVGAFVFSLISARFKVQAINVAGGKEAVKTAYDPDSGWNTPK